MPPQDQIISAAVLVFLCLGFLTSTLADLLNLTHISPVLPKAVSDTFDALRYEKAQNYLKATTRSGIAASALDLGALLLFWFSGGFGILDLLIRELRVNPIASGLLYIGCLAGLKLLLSLPFSLWRTFVIEEAFGFNQTTAKTYISDLMKTIVISGLLGSLLLGLVLFLFQAGGSWAWAFCWTGTSIFVLAIQYLVPTWILPLFNTFTPLADSELKTAIFAYAGSIGFPLTQIFVMDGSRRSGKSNAFFTGFGNNRRIVLYDTLIKAHTTAELVAILAHEMGHYKKKHIQHRLAMAICHMGILFFLLSFFIHHPGLCAAFGVEQPSVYAGLVFFGILFSPMDTALSLVIQYLSRKNELEADLFAASTTQGPGPMISALKKLSAHNLSNLTPHPFYVFLNHSHPPVLERISRLEQLETP